MQLAIHKSQGYVYTTYVKNGVEVFRCGGYRRVSDQTGIRYEAKR